MWRAAYIAAAFETLTYECGLIFSYRSDFALILFMAPLFWLALAVRTALIMMASRIVDEEGWQFVFLAALIGAIAGVLFMVIGVHNGNGNGWFGFTFALTFAATQIVAALIYLRTRNRIANSPPNSDARQEAPRAG